MQVAAHICIYMEAHMLHKLHYIQAFCTAMYTLYNLLNQNDMHIPNYFTEKHKNKK